ncbi:MAG: ABC transporter substrate-binding protein [Chloroflexota bacterium]|nr:ABC transporter substrate-binding protein [Chloroflexota bacterium]
MTLRKLSALALLVLLLTGMLAACAPKEEAGPVTIQVYYPVAVDAPIAAIFDGYIEKFQEQNPNITVEAVYSGGYGDVKTAIQTTIDGGGEPPALAVMLATDLYDLVNAGYILALDDYIAADEDGAAYMQDFIASFMENSHYDGKTWSIPFQRSAVLMYYNADFFAEAGLEPPDSWAAWGEAGQALTQKDSDEVTRWGIEFPSGWPYWLFQPLAIGNGQNIIGEGDAEVYFDDPKVIEAVQFYIDLSEKYGAMAAGVQSIWGQAPTDLASGQTAMIVHSSGSLNTLLEQADFEVGVMPLPGKTAGTYASVPGGGNLYLFDNIDKVKQDAAWKFIRFLSEPERAADFSIQSGYFASCKGAYETEVMKAYMADNPQVAQARAALDVAGAEFSVQNLGEVRGIFHNYLQQAYNGELSAAEAMAAAQAEADAAMEAFK